MGVAIAKQAADPITGVALIHTVVPPAAAVWQLVSPASLRPHRQSTAPAQAHLIARSQIIAVQTRVHLLANTCQIKTVLSLAQNSNLIDLSSLPIE